MQLTVPKLLNYTTQISLATIVLISLFNVGYFFEAGIHYLGIIDISNFVYSFGLVFPILVIVLLALSSNPALRFFKLIRRSDGYTKLIKFVLVVFDALVVLMLMAIFFGSWVDDWLKPDRLVLVIFLFMSALVSAIGIFGLVLLHKKINIDLVILTSTIVFVALFIFFIGRFVAYYEIHDDPNYYNVVTKSSTMDRVRLVRSSSIGFLISTGEKIVFVPNHEILQITFDVTKQK